MWSIWAALLLITSVLGDASSPASGLNTAMIRRQLRTLDRGTAERALRSWLHSPDNGNQNASPGKITKRFPPLLSPDRCKDGHKLDSDECVEVFTVNPKEHEQNFLDQLNSHIDPNNYDPLDYGKIK